MKVDFDLIGNVSGVHAVGLGNDVTAQVQDQMWLAISDQKRGETVMLKADQLRNLLAFLGKLGWKS